MLIRQMPQANSLALIYQHSLASNQLSLNLRGRYFGECVAFGISIFALGTKFL